MKFEGTSKFIPLSLQPPRPHTVLHRINTSRVKLRPEFKKIHIFLTT